MAATAGSGHGLGLLAMAVAVTWLISLISPKKRVGAWPLTACPKCGGDGCRRCKGTGLRVRTSVRLLRILRGRR